MPAGIAQQANPNAAIDIFVKIKGAVQGVIKGESFDAGHKDEIVAHSYNWDVTQPYDKSHSGLAAGKRQLGVFKFVMTTQSATPKLLQAACTGEVLSTVTFTCRKAGGKQQEYMVWTLTNALVVKLETGYLTPGEVAPYDQVSLTFRAINLTYKTQNADGTLGGGIMFEDDWQI